MSHQVWHGVVYNFCFFFVFSIHYTRGLLFFYYTRAGQRGWLFSTLFSPCVLPLLWWARGIPDGLEIWILLAWRIITFWRDNEMTKVFWIMQIWWFIIVEKRPNSGLRRPPSDRCHSQSAVVKNCGRLFLLREKRHAWRILKYDAPFSWHEAISDPVAKEHVFSLLHFTTALWGEPLAGYFFVRFSFLFTTVLLFLREIVCSCIYFLVRSKEEEEEAIEGIEVRSYDLVEIGALDIGLSWVSLYEQYILSVLMAPKMVNQNSHLANLLKTTSWGLCWQPFLLYDSHNGAIKFKIYKSALF